MADSHYTGVPQVEPETRAPEDYQHINADSSMFGGQIAQATEKLGAGATTAGKFFGQVAADDASNQFQDRVNKLLHGDPNNPVTGPDGKPQPDLGYLGLKGRAAMEARPNVEQQLDNLLKDTRSNLTTAEQQLHFDNFSRRYRTVVSGQIGTHADTQSNSWYKEVNHASGNIALNHIAQNAWSEDEFLHGTSDLVQARVKDAQIQGAQPGDALYTNAVEGAKRDALKTRLQIIGATDPGRALRMLDANKDVAGYEYDTLTKQFQSHADQQTGIVGGQRAIIGAPSAEHVHSAIIRQESGGNPNAATSVNGAQGIGQITPKTFAAYARPGENIANPKDNLAVSRRIIDDLYQKYNGDAQRVAVGYFSGPGNVAPEGSPTPWIRDAADGNGKRTSSYVADVSNRLAGTPGASSKQVAVQRVMNDPSLSPAARSHAIGSVDQFYNAQHAETQTVKRMVDDDLNSVLTTGKPLTGLSPERVSSALGPSSADEFATNRGIAQNYYQQMHDWSNITAEQIQDRVQMLKPPAGSPGYSYAQNLQEHAAKAADLVIKKRYEDPAGSVDHMPDVAAARASLNPADPKSYGPLVSARLYAQTRLGIPEGAQSSITEEEAKRYSALLRPVSKGQADVQNQEQVIGSVVNEVNQKYGTHAQAAMSRVLYHVTMKSDAADVLAAAMTRWQQDRAGPLVTPEEVRRVQIERDAERAAQIAGQQREQDNAQVRENLPSTAWGAAPVDPSAIGPEIRQSEQGKQKPFWQAVDLLRSDPQKYIEPFAKRFGMEAVPQDMRAHLPQPGAPQSAGKPKPQASAQ